MQFSVVNKSELNEEFRIDSEYYSPENMRKEDAVLSHKHEPLGKLCDLIAGPFGSTVTTERYNQSSGKRYIRGKDIQPFFIEETDAVYIEGELFDELPQFHLIENDLLLTVVGMKFGKVAIISNKDTPSIFSCKSTLIRNTRINAWYLLAYLSCSIGYGLIRRGQRGAAQPGINLFDIQTVPVPLFSEHFQSQTESEIKKARNLLKKSSESFFDAQSILLSELGLTNWQPRYELTFIKNYSETKQEERIDAEYYQPKYEEIIKAIKGYSGGWGTLGDLCNTKRGTLIKDIFYDESKGVPYIRGADFSGGQLTKDKLVFINQKFCHKTETKVEENEIVFSLIGSVGETALVTKEFSDSYISNNTGKMTCIKKISPVVLQVLLKSIIGKMYFEKYKTQTAQPKISDKDTHNFVLPILSEKKQTKIKQKVTESFHLHKQSKHLLECAKRAVEIAIEQDEKKAIDWLKEQIQDIGVLDADGL